MPWDEELDRLMRFVHEHFGEEELEAALDRAVATVARGGSTAADLLADDGTIASAVGTVIPVETYYEALRTELRRLARPH